MAAENAAVMGDVVVAILTLGQLFLVVDKIQERRKKENGQAPVTRNEFQSLVRRFDNLVAERRSDVNFLISQLTHGADSRRGPGPNFRLLLIEDDPDDALLFRKRMSSQFEIDSASTLAEAETLMARNRYDCILLDLKLPDLPGGATSMELFRARWPHAVCLIMTGSENPELLTKAADLNFEAVLVKQVEFDARDVAGKVKSAIMRHRH